ncbi:MAG: cysteine desulfurase [Streptococcaceae bacterium]|jgi:cysteine desulfurase|nr:cysteine desulfurase [Streptococcaceae bacterium]
MIYLDNAATTQPFPEVAEKMRSSLINTFGNPSSTHTAGRSAAKLLRDSRKKIARILQVPAKSLIFTSGASEANNSAIISYALANIEHGRHIVTTAIEHPSVLEAMRYLDYRFGFEITTVTPDSDGNLSASRVLSAVRPDTILVSAMLANNETGQILPVAEIGKVLAPVEDIAFHVDAVQAMGKIPVLPLEIGADFLTASAHKFHGPKGVGFLYHSPNVKFDSLIHGGNQEDKRRAGTENLAGISGMAAALEISHQHLSENYQKVLQLHDHLLSNLNNLKIDFYENRFGLENLPHVLNLGFPGVRNDLLLMRLDMTGAAVSTGSACTAGAVETSHVLEAVYDSDSPRLHENLRISLSEMNTLEEIDQFTTLLKNCL